MNVFKQLTCGTRNIAVHQTADVIEVAAHTLGVNDSTTPSDFGKQENGHRQRDYEPSIAVYVKGSSEYTEQMCFFDV